MKKWTSKNKGTSRKELAKVFVLTVLFVFMLVAPDMKVQAENKVVTLSGTGELTQDYVNEHIGDATEIVISGFSSIGDEAFGNNGTIKKVIFNDGLETIGSYAFWECNNLESIAIPQSVTLIDYGAFSGCSSLLNVTIPGSVSEIGSFAFEACSSLETVTIEDGVSYIGSFTFESCSNLKKVTIPNSVTSMGSSAFEGCTELTTAGPTGGGYSIEFGWNSEIPDYAFYGLADLTSIMIPNSISSIGYYAFYGCSNLTTIAIPDGVTSIGDGAFTECSSLTDITIPNSVQYLGDSVFEECSSLTHATLSENISFIGYYLFYRCGNLTKVNIPDGVSYIDESAFYGCTNLQNTRIPDGVTSIGASAFFGCKQFTNIEIPDSVTVLGELAFAGCTNLKTIKIPHAVNEMGANLFSNCKNLTILGYSGSTAEEYANNNSISFQSLGQMPENPPEQIVADLKFVLGSDGKYYWYEGGIRQGTYDDPKGVIGDGTVRGREIYDPESDGWYWLDACFDGAKACSKEVWMPYIYQNEKNWDDAEIEANANNSGSMKQQVIEYINKGYGKWVRYDADGKMIKGWYTVEGDDEDIYPTQKGNTYYYDYQTGLMAKGWHNIDGIDYYFDETTGVLQK